MSPILVPKVRSRVFPIRILDFLDFSMLDGNVDVSSIWHRRYGYLRYDTLKFLNKKKMINGWHPFP